MAWHLDASYTTWQLNPTTPDYVGLTNQIPRADLKAGDALVNDVGGNHMVLFDHWADSSHTAIVIDEEPDYGLTERQKVYTAATAAKFVPIRYSKIVDDLPAPASPVRGAIVAMKLQNTGSGRTEVHAMSEAGNYANFGLHAATSFGLTNSTTSTYMFADYNGDGVPDLYWIKENGATNTEVHVFDGTTNYNTALLHTSTPFAKTTSANTEFALSGGTRPDLNIISMNGTASKKVEVHRLSGASTYHSYTLHQATALPAVSPTRWHFSTADYNRDGATDLYAITLNGSSTGKTEIHVLSGAGGSYNTYLLHQATPLAQTTNELWQFAVATHTGHTVPDVYAIATTGTGGKVDVHILNGATHYTSYYLQTHTALTSVNSTQWQFTVAPTASASAQVPCGSTPGSGTAVTKWNSVVKCVLGMLKQPQTTEYINDVDILIQYESGGDPTICNNWDSNAIAGHPSCGLIQVIQPTFDTWHSSALPNNLVDAAANLYAGLNYGIHTYGSIPDIPGVYSINHGGPYKPYDQRR